MRKEIDPDVIIEERKKGKERMHLKRINETLNERNHGLEGNRKRLILKRQNETESEKNDRFNENKYRILSIRKGHSMLQSL